MKLRSGLVVGYKIQYDITPCVICMDVKYLPVRLTPCGHTFCDLCIRLLVSKSINITLHCPLCRCEIEDCEHDTYLARKVKKSYPCEYRKNEKTSQRQNLKNYPLPTKSNLPIIRKTIINNSILRILTSIISSSNVSTMR
ncbi:MAG: hypothetical protein CXT79_02985 [Thaumarchaeota archaeon]|nr:MAG: hypothetical protein CXT79_02985 [Nitrososphaerota archaeon]